MKYESSNEFAIVGPKLRTVKFCFPEYLHDSSLTSRSSLLMFFSSLVIQEHLISLAGERRRSKKDSHCESFFVFCLSLKIGLQSAKAQAFLTLSARLFKSLTAKLEPSSLLSALCRTLIFHQCLVSCDDC